MTDTYLLINPFILNLVQTDFVFYCWAVDVCNDCKVPLITTPPTIKMDSALPLHLIVEKMKAGYPEFKSCHLVLAISVEASVLVTVTGQQSCCIDFLPIYPPT